MQASSLLDAGMVHRVWAKRAIVLPTLLVLAGCASSAARAEDLAGLDRGHRLLIEHGFQLVALVDAQLTAPEHWRDLRYTTMVFSDHYASADPTGQSRARDIERFTDAQWGRLTWNRETSSARLADIVTAAERPFIDRMTMLQYLDEQRIDKPENVEDARVVLADWRKRYPDAIVFTNQVGGVWEPEVLRRYAEQAQPDMLYFDRYVFKGQLPDTDEDAERRLHYLALQRTRKAAIAGHAGSHHRPIPFGMYTQNTVIPRNDHVASESETRFQYFTALAFGCKSIAAFTYARDIRIDKLEHYMFAGANDPSAPNDSQPLPLCAVFADCNRQTLNLAPTLVRLISTDVRVVRGRRSDGIANSLAGTEVADWNSEADPFMRSVTAKNEGKVNDGQPGDVIVGFFKPLIGGAGDDVYFMIVNGLTGPDASSEETTQRIAVEFDFGATGIDSLERLNRDTGVVEHLIPGTPDWENTNGAKYRLELSLPGGTGDLFRFKTGRPFIRG